MKNLKVILLSFMSSGALYALPIGNPTEPGLLTSGAIIYSYGCYDIFDPCFNWYEGWSVRVGFYGDYVFNRKMEVGHYHDAAIEEVGVTTNAGYVALNFCNRVDIFTTLGATDLCFFSNMNSFPLSNYVNEGIEVLFPSAFSWSIGARAILWELGCFGVGIEGQYFRTSPDFDAIIAGVDSNYTYSGKQNATYDEWQVGTGISYRFEIHNPDIALVPYLGVSWSKASLDMDSFQLGIVGSGSTIVFADLRSQNPWSYSVGATLTFFETIGISVEGRFAGQKALYVNGQIRF